MATEKRYNGWFNYETWCVNLWLTNEEGTYDFWHDNAKHVFRQATIKHESYLSVSEQARFDLSKLLKEQIEESQPELGASMWADLLGAALSEVDWQEIANAFLEEEEYGEEKYESAD